MIYTAPRQGLFAVIILASFCLHTILLVVSTERQISENRMQKGERLITQLITDSELALSYEDKVSLSVIANRYTNEFDVNRIIIRDVEDEILVQTGDAQLQQGTSIEKLATREKTVIGNVELIMKATSKGEIVKMLWLFILGSLVMHFFIWVIYGRVARPTQVQLQALSRDIHEHYFSQYRQTDDRQTREVAGSNFYQPQTKAQLDEDNDYQESPSIIDHVTKVTKVETKHEQSIVQETQETQEAEENGEDNLVTEETIRATTQTNQKQADKKPNKQLGKRANRQANKKKTGLFSGITSGLFAGIFNKKETSQDDNAKDTEANDIAIAENNTAATLKDPLENNSETSLKTTETCELQQAGKSTTHPNANNTIQNTRHDSTRQDTQAMSGYQHQETAPAQAKTSRPSGQINAYVSSQLDEMANTTTTQAHSSTIQRPITQRPVSAVRTTTTSARSLPTQTASPAHADTDDIDLPRIRTVYTSPSPTPASDKTVSAASSTKHSATLRGNSNPLLAKAQSAHHKSDSWATQSMQQAKVALSEEGSKTSIVKKRNISRDLSAFLSSQKTTEQNQKPFTIQEASTTATESTEVDLNNDINSQLANTNDNEPQQHSLIPETVQIQISYIDKFHLLDKLSPAAAAPYFKLCGQLLKQASIELFKQPNFNKITLSNQPTFDVNGATIELQSNDVDQKTLTLAAVMLAELYKMLNQIVYDKHRELGRFAFAVAVGVSQAGRENAMQKLLENKAEDHDVMMLLAKSELAHVESHMQLSRITKPTNVSERECAYVKQPDTASLQLLTQVRNAVLKVEG